jgi:lysophospholipid acyltransferase (LPLAT)-like uncharacterized protein
MLRSAAMSLKAVLRSAPVQAAIRWLVALYIRLVFHTNRWRWQGLELHECWAASGQAVIYCFWHNRMAMMVYARRSPRVHHMIISPHADGRMIAGIVARFGIHTIFASSSRGGHEGFKQAIAALRAGDMLCITPDGPRGPRMRIGFGPIDLSRRAGVPLLPLAFSTTRRRVFGSWDRFILPLPFGRGVFIVGEPMTVERACTRAAREAARAEFERRLIGVAAEADRLTGHPPIEPAAAVAVQSGFQ